VTRSVLLAGCGNIGFRHLQAICTVPEALHVTVVEPMEAMHQRIFDEFQAAGSSGHRFELMSALPSSPNSFDLTVVATAAAQRRALVEQILDRHTTSVMILEKILFQTIADIDAVAQRLVTDGVEAFVNCGRRTFGGYRALRERLEGPIDITVRGNRFGLASNAVHFLDLSEFLNDSTLSAVDMAGLDAGARDGKRHGVVEIFGTITAVCENGGRLIVESRDKEPVVISVEVRSGTDVIVINELARTQTEGADVTPFASQNVSETTEIYQDAVATGSCALTPYEDSARQHRLFIRELRNHLGLSNDTDEPCPVS